ncbi:hypothetical protein [Pedobacter suwonensis]|uniref:hypothetical protein n=1 Tax=Pedobacter suwonensis TaxID=332999 RepID=UPI000B83D47E|nr:hypothetical protein [Pedobacter suwonensis]
MSAVKTSSAFLSGLMPVFYPVRLFRRSEKPACLGKKHFKNEMVVSSGSTASAGGTKNRLPGFFLKKGLII